jgi:hypothetical protein
MSIGARKLTSGKTVYDVRLRDPDGRAYKRTFRTKREAEAFDAAERTDRARGAWIDPRKAATTFVELATRWLNGNPAKRPTSVERDEVIIRLHLLPELSRRPVGSITPPDVQRVVNRRAITSWRSSKSGSRSSIRRMGMRRMSIMNSSRAASIGSGKLWSRASVIGVATTPDVTPRR